MATSRGFTLLELVVVLFIVGLVAGFAVLAVGDGGRSDAAEREAQRLRALFELASQDAILQGRELGAVLSRDSYRFLMLGDQGWTLLDQDAEFRERTLPEGIRMDLILEGRRVPIAGADRGVLPQLVFFTDGEVSPFQIALTHEGSGNVMRITGKANGMFEIEFVEGAL